MRIDGSNIAQLGDKRATESRSARDVSEAPGAATAAAKADDTRGAVVVKLRTAEARAEGAGKLTAEVAQRLDRVREQILSGDYKLDFESLAERIADEELARSGR